MALRSLVARVMESPAVYRVWQAPFVSSKLRPMLERTQFAGHERVLDVGCGPGTNAPFFAGLDYVGIDINDRYLRRARARYTGRFLQGDLATADLTTLGTFDHVLVNSVLHHLADEVVDRLLVQIGELLAESGRLHVLELVMPDRRSLPRLMAVLDRGRYARDMGHWQALLSRRLEPLIVEPYSFGGGLWEMVYFQGKAKP